MLKPFSKLEPPVSRIKPPVSGLKAPVSRLEAPTSTLKPPRSQFAPPRQGFISPSGVEADEPTMRGAISTVAGTFAESWIEQATFGIYYPEDIIGEKKEQLYKPYAEVGHFTGEIAGTISSFIGTGIALAHTPFIGAALLAMHGTAKTGLIGSKLATSALGRAGARFGAEAIRGGMVAGTTYFTKEAVKQVKEKDLNIPQLAEKTLEAVGLFGLTGGAGAAIGTSVRILRGLAGGLSLSGAGIMLRLAKGEAVEKEDMFKEFIIGFVFDTLLSKRIPTIDTKKIGMKAAMDTKRWFEVENWDKLSKEEMNKKVVEHVRSIMGKGNEEVVDVIQRTIGLYQKTAKESYMKRSMLIDPKKAAKDVPKWLVKATNAQKRRLSSLMKDIPEMNRAQIKGKKGSKAQRKMYEQLVQDVYGEKITSKDMSIREMDFMLKGTQRYVDAMKKDLEKMFGQARAPDMTQYVTPGDATLINLRIYDVLEPGIKAKTIMDAEIHNTYNWLIHLEKRLLDVDKVGALSRLEATVFKKGAAVGSLRRLITDLDNPKFDPMSLPTNEHREIYKTFRRFFDVMLLRLNSYNRYFGHQEVKSLKGYVRRKRQFQLDVEKFEKEYGGKVSVFGEKKVSKPREKLPTEMKRTIKEVPIEDLVASPAELAMDMMRWDLKRIYMEEPTIALNRLLQHYGKEIPTATRRYAAEYHNRVLLGHMGDRTRIIDATIRKIGTLPAIKQIAGKMEKVFGRDLGASPTHALSRGYGRTLNLAWIGFRVDLGLRNVTQKLLPLAFYGERAAMKAMNPYQTKHARDAILNHSFFQKSVRAPIESVSGEISKFEKVARYPMGMTHKSNVYFSMLTAYHSTVDKFLNPKKWNLGWADPKRVAGGKPTGGKLLFDSETKKLSMEMWVGGRYTQWDYTAVGRAPMHWSPEGRAVFKFWTWPMNYTFVFWREMIHRGLRNSPSWDKTGKLKLTTRERAAAITHLGYTSGMMFAFAKAGIDMSSIGIGYKSTLLTGDEGGVPGLNLGPLPSQGTHLIGMVTAFHRLVAGGSPYEVKKAWNTLSYYTNIPAYLPGASEIRKLHAFKEEGLKGVLFRPIKKEKGKLGPRTYTPKKRIKKEDKKGIPFFRPLWRD